MHQVIAFTVEFDGQSAPGRLGTTAVDTGVRVQTGDVGAQSVAGVA